MLTTLFVFAAESHARQIEYLRAAGVAIDGTITEITVSKAGGRQPNYWISGTYPAVSPAGRDVVLPFRFHITSAEFDDYAKGDAIPLIYDPDRYNVPLRAGHYEQTHSDQIRIIAAIGVAVYVAAGIVLTIVESRRRTRESAAESKLRRAFGTR